MGLCKVIIHSLLFYIYSQLQQAVFNVLLSQTTDLVFFIPSCREEYGKLFDFVNAKKLSIKNRGFKEVGHLEFSIYKSMHHMSSVISVCEPHMCLLPSVDELILLCVFVLCSFVCVPVEKGWYEPCGLRARCD